MTSQPLWLLTAGFLSIMAALAGWGALGLRQPTGDRNGRRAARPAIWSMR